MNDERVNDERLAGAYREGLAPPDPSRPECPSPEALERLVVGEGSEEARLRTLDHVMGCTACLPELELLRAVHAAETADAEPGAGRTPSHAETPMASGRETTSRLSPRSLALAASIAVLVAATFVIRAGVGRDGTVRGGAESLAVAPVGVVERPTTLTWRSADDEASYTVELLAPDGSALFTTTTSDTVVVLPTGLVLEADVTYRWILSVTTLESGTSAGPAAEFRVR